ncbi:diguanylate cyclase domain-containing protein [Celerinatantimonas sp. YJH-8]|uniref:sensor domain-containing diguanylate cyclase n=1 Tax=Celerinatantimonas sp. YJH-8 TaxID=3228714 RepID=UPI0038C29C22
MEGYSSLPQLFDDQYHGRVGSQERLLTILECSNNAYWELDVPTLQVLYAWSFWNPRNQSFKPMYANSSLSVIQEYIHPEDLGKFTEAFQSYLQGKISIFERTFRYRTNDEHPWRWLHCRGRMIQRDPQGYPKTIAGIYQDVSYEQAQQKQLSQMAMCDPLTGLPNRYALQHDFNRHRTDHPNQPLALFYLDLDGFKEVNDKINHRAGDQLLCQLAQKLSQQTRLQEQIYRIGGDEFALVVFNFEQISDLQILAERIRQQFNQHHVVIHGRTIHVGISIGIATLRVEDTLDTLLERADTRMYQVKHNGKNGYQYRVSVK